MPYKLEVKEEKVPQARKAGVRVFTISTRKGGRKLTLAGVSVKEFKPGHWLASFALTFPLDEEDAPKAYEEVFKYFVKVHKPQQVISFNEDEDLENSKVLLKQYGALVLNSTITEEEIIEARKFWDSSEFWGF